MSRFDDADVVGRRFLKSNPEDPELQFLQARTSHSLGKRLDAQKFLDTLLARRPQFTPGLMLRAILFYEADEAEKAIPLLRKVISEGNGTHKEASYHLGLALARAGQTQEAKQILAEVQRDNFEKDTFAMDSSAVRVRRAELLFNCGRGNEAIDLLRAVLKVDPQCVSAHQLMASKTNESSQ